jgi:hypothetical protein
MSNYVTSRELGVALCEALGIDHTSVNRMVITIPANDLVTIDITRLLPIDRVGPLVAMLSRYKLVADE